MNKERLRIFAKVVLVVSSMTIGAKIPYSILGNEGTFQTFFLCLTALAFTKWEVLSGQVLYLICGLFLPVFSSTEYGMAILTGRSAGFLFAFPVAAFVLAHLKTKQSDRDLFGMISLAVLAHFIILLTEAIWLNFRYEKNLNDILFQIILAYLPGVFIKSGLAGLIIYLAARFLKPKKA